MVIFAEIFSGSLIAQVNHFINSYDIDPVTYLRIESESLESPSPCITKTNPF